MFKFFKQLKELKNPKCNIISGWIIKAEVHSNVGLFTYLSMEAYMEYNCTFKTQGICLPGLNQGPDLETSLKLRNIENMHGIFLIPGSGLILLFTVWT